MKTNSMAGRITLLAMAAAGSAAAAVDAAENAHKAESQCRTVQANAAWQGTGVTVNPGQFVCVAAEGLWSHGAQGIQAITPFYGPQGFGKDDPNNVPEVVSRVGALIGKIGTNSPFLIEKQLCFIPGATGELMLSMNDDPGAFGNNTGRLHVQIVEWADSRWVPDHVKLDPKTCRPK